ncbi:MAG: glycosyltransferase family 2 protein [Phycisphaeraceae bacterium]|nr:glycosyltransferase family 2 protein [Phycisphaeraceae bacterium]
MPDSSPRFSVIMPCYNRRKLIRAAVMSVLDQTFTDFELIVVDDGSTDDTLDVLADITDARLSLHQQRNSGPGAARNKGIGIAQGQYVAFLDSDDLYLPWTLQNYDQALKQNKDPSLLICEAKDFHHDAQMNSVVQKPLEVQCYENYLQAADQDFWIGASVVAVKRQVVLASGGFNNAKVNQEDCDLWLRLGTAPGFIAIASPICSGRRWHEQNVSHEIARNIAGVQYLIQQQKHGAYPLMHSRELLTILTRHIRPASLDCIKHGDRGVALEFYRKSFFWNLKLGRLRYLLGFWVRMILGGRVR